MKLYEFVVDVSLQLMFLILGKNAYLVCHDQSITSQYS